MRNAALRRELCLYPRKSVPHRRASSQSQTNLRSHRCRSSKNFHQHLRALAQSAVRTVLELVMREEFDAFIGAAWGECSPKRRGYRNGTYTRDLAIATGRLEEIKVPRDRAGQFHGRAFERYSRYEPHIAEGLTQMFVAGVSTHKVGEVRSKPSWGSLPVPAPSVGSTGFSPNNMRRGGSVLCKRIGGSSTSMACISAFAMGKKPMPRSS